MVDENTAEKAWDEWRSTQTDAPFIGPRAAFMGGRASRDAEVAALEDAVIANERASVAAEAGEESAIARAIRAERTLAEAQATIEKVYKIRNRHITWHGLSISEEADIDAVLAGALAAPSAPSSTGGANKPEVVCLCGSTRFYDEFQAANYMLTMQGKIVLSVGFYPHAKAQHGHGEGIGHDSAEKVALDELHKRKIDMADRVLVLNVGGYIGESTRSEIEYAVAHGKPVDYDEPLGGNDHE